MNGLPIGLSKTDEKLTLPKIRVNESFNPYTIKDEWIEYITSSLREAIEEEGSSPSIGERGSRSRSGYNLSQNVLGRATSWPFRLLKSD
jgi:hypothetical protein